jgi:hypothetical protein
MHKTDQFNEYVPRKVQQDYRAVVMVVVFGLWRVIHIFFLSFFFLILYAGIVIWSMRGFRRQQTLALCGIDAALGSGIFSLYCGLDALHICFLCICFFHQLDSALADGSVSSFRDLTALYLIFLSHLLPLLLFLSLSLWLLALSYLFVSIDHEFMKSTQATMNSTQKER